MSQYAQYMPLPLRQYLNTLGWGVSERVNRKLDALGHERDGNATIEEVQANYVKVLHNGILVRVNFKGRS